MNISELEKRLYEEGCNPNSYAIGKRGSASDAYCLTHNGQEWQVYYTERGSDDAPEYTSKSEEEACEYFFHLIMKFRHDHCVGSFVSKSAANQYHVKLASHGLHPFWNNIPYPVLKQPLYRVWVSGKEIFAVEKIVGSRFVTDQPEKKRDVE